MNAASILGITTYLFGNPYFELQEMIKTDEDNIRIEWHRSKYLPRKQKKRLRKQLLGRMRINSYGNVMFGI